MTINHLWAVRWPLPKQQRPNCTSSLRGGGCHPPCPNPAQPSWLPESVPCFSASCSNQIFTGTSLVYQAQRLFFHQASTQDSGHRWLKSNAHLAGAGSREWRWEKASIAHHLGEPKRALPTTLKGDLVLCSTGSVLCLPSISSRMERNSPKARRLRKASGQSFFSQSCWSHQFPPQLAEAWTQETSEGSPLITGVELHHRPHGTLYIKGLEAVLGMSQAPGICSSCRYKTVPLPNSSAPFQKAKPNFAIKL